MLLDPENIPAAQERIRGLQEDLSGIDAELSRQPPSEADINAEVTAVLSSLHWLSVAFSYLSEEAYIKRYQATGEDKEGRFDSGGGVVGVLETRRDHAPVRRWLQALQGITVRSERTGEGQATRYPFLGGEIHLNAQFELLPEMYAQQDSNLQPLVPKTNALSN